MTILLSLILGPLGEILGIIVAVGGAILYGKYYQAKAEKAQAKADGYQAQAEIAKGARRCSMRWIRWWKKLTRKSRLATLLACLTTLILSSSGCASHGPYLTLPKPPMPVAPKLYSQPTPPPPPAEEKGVWFPLKDTGALMIYLDKLKGKCREDDVVIDNGNEYLKKH